MAGHQETAYANYIPLESRGDSPTRSNSKYAAEAHTVNVLATTIQPKALDHSRQIWSLLLPQTARWLGTVVISILLVLVLRIYSTKGNFTSNDKNVFNVIITALSVGLGINFFEAFKESAKGLRWRILADQRHNVREVDLILSIESLWKVFVLAMESIPSKPGTIAACALWITLNITAQISVALVTITFDMVDGRNFNDTYTRFGIVNASDVGCFNVAKVDKCPLSGDSTSHSRAHLYGETIPDEPYGYYRNISDVSRSKHDYTYFSSKTNTAEFTYRFREFNPGDSGESYPLFTNRTVTASTGDCFIYRIRNETKLRDVEGKGPGKKYIYENDTFTAEIEVPSSSVGKGSTTYMYKGFEAPEITGHNCGDRCLWLWAYQNTAVHQHVNEVDPPKFYRCPVTVSEVRNVRNESQQLPEGVARIAAVSIALQGRWSGNAGHRNFNQYQFYPFGTRWEIHGQNVTRVRMNMALFAIGSIARMAAMNPRRPVEGLVPHLGSHLEIRWGYVTGLFGGIVVTHLVLFLSAIFAIRKVAIKDDSFLAVGRLLLPLLNILGNGGTLLTGKEVAKAIQSQLNTGGTGMVVGPRANEDRSGYHLDVGEEVPLRSKWPENRHPAGMYA